eukprot:gene9609-biopygen12241
MHCAPELAGDVRTQKVVIWQPKHQYLGPLAPHQGRIWHPGGTNRKSLVFLTGGRTLDLTWGKRQRTRTGRGPDAGRTIEFEETDADRTRTGRGRG